MENKINIAELLKNCPSGMELDCTMFSNVTFVRVDNSRKQFPIEIAVGGLHSKYLTKEGCFHDTTLLPEAKCVIFPKGKTTWEGFVLSCKFKDGDIIYTETVHNCKFISIFKKYNNEFVQTYIDYSLITNNHYCENTNYLIEINNVLYNRLCTEEEKQKLFDAIKASGYKWNLETKTFEKLSKFKVGDRIRKMGETSTYTITDVNNAHYFCGKYVICDTCDNDWELVPNKFDINTLKVFDKVLVRDSNEGMWSASIFSHTWENRYICIGVWYNQCIPYEGNEHLLGTANDCDEYYKTWE